MIRPADRLSVLCLAVYSAALAPAFADAPDGDANAHPLAALAVKTLGSPGGIVSLPRCRDAKLAVALAKQGRYLVHAACPDDAAVARLAGAADRAGLWETGVIAERGEPHRSGLAGRSVNAIVLTDLTADDLRQMDLQAVLRPLAPGGKVLLGTTDPSARGATDPKTLGAWASRAGLIQEQLLGDGSGNWVVARAPGLHGADDWSHWHHGPDNNPVSRDTAHGWPPATQWMGTPYHMSRNSFVLAAGGRVFFASAPVASYTRPTTPPGLLDRGNLLICRDGRNGRLLWTHALGKSPGLLAPARVATPETFYLPRDGNVIALDAATGEPRRTYPLGGASEQILWTAKVGDRLYCLKGPKPEQRRRHTRGKPMDWIVGDELLALDLAGGQVLWRHRRADVDARACAVRDGKVYYYARGKRVAALSARDGEELWTFEDPEVLKEMTALLNPGKIDGITLYRAGLVATDRAVIVNLNSRKNRVVLSAERGRVLWTNDLRGGNGGRGGHMLVLGDVLLSKGMRPRAVELMTGKPVEGRTFSYRGGCGRFTATPYALIGMLGAYFDLSSEQTLGDSYAKPDCHVGTFVAGGVSYNPAGSCKCALPFRGFVARATRDGEDFRPMSPDERHEAHPELGAAPLEPTAADWPTYRANGDRSNSSPVALGDGELARRWLAEAPSPAMPTAAVAAGEIVVHAAHDGRVRCLDADTGRPRWTYLTGGAILTAPTIAHGRVYVGSADGWVYCLAADSGQLCWRFHVAPSRRRIMLYGHLSSTWPVHSGVVVRDGVAYAVGGLVDHDGVHVVALDARTGELKWHNDELGDRLPEPGAGVHPLGRMAVAKGRLHLRTDSAYPCSLDLTTGELLEPGKEFQGLSTRWVPNAARGADVGVYDGDLLIEGGQRLYAAQWERTLGRRIAFSFKKLDDAGRAVFPYVWPLEGSTFLPTWDAELTLTTQPAFRKPKTLEAWSTRKTASWARELVGKHTGDQRTLRKLRNWAVTGRTFRKTPDRLWGPTQDDVNAMALAADGVVVAEGVHESQRSWVPASWRLAVLDRATGKPLAAAALPAEPVYGAMCIDREGRIVVPLVDGSVACFRRGR